MKLKIVTLLFVCFFGIQNGIAKMGIPIPYGEEEKIVKIIDLPDTDEFKLDDGTFFDIGSMYTISHIVWLPYSNTEPKIVGYVNDDTYLDLSEDDLKRIKEITNLNIPTTATATFFDRIGGKIGLGILGLIVLYGVYSSYFGKDKDE
jgi:hypothetical protein